MALPKFMAPSQAQKEAVKDVPARERNSTLEALVTTALKATKDPSSRLRVEEAPRLSFKQLFHVADPDKRGWREVLYLDVDDRPMTAWVAESKPFELMTVEVGW